MGRNDNQVKIRGHRIELGEIEQVLQTQATISQAAVTVKTVDKDKTIVAYILPESGTVDKEALKNDLKQLLPEYMIPNHYVEVTEMPLNANGKVDYKALPELKEVDIIRTEYVAPTSETEQKLVDIWQNLLQLEQIGIKDNFFDLGGHSIKAIKMSHDISTVFELDVSIKNIFVYPTIEQLAAQIEIAKKQQEAITSNTELNEIEI
jgi:acyl carrier protein